VRRGLFTAMAAMDLSGRLPSLGVPVSIVVGEHDRVLEPDRSRRLAELITDARLEIIPEAGHMLPCEAPDRLAEILRTATSPDRSPAPQGALP
jgi:non-heme chloroperoxidase